MKVCVVGTGYVGLTTGVSLAFLGHDVTCVDLDQAKVDMLRGGKCPIYEPGMEDLLAEAVQNLTFTTSYEDAVPGADVVFVAVQTPSAEDGSPDLRYLRGAAVNSLKVGERIEFITAHVCPVINLTDQVIVTDGSSVVDTWKVEGRGRTQ